MPRPLARMVLAAIFIAVLVSMEILAVAARRLPQGITASAVLYAGASLLLVVIVLQWTVPRIARASLHLNIISLFYIISRALFFYLLSILLYPYLRFFVLPYIHTHWFRPSQAATAMAIVLWTLACARLAVAGLGVWAARRLWSLRLCTACISGPLKHGDANHISVSEERYLPRKHVTSNAVDSISVPNARMSFGFSATAILFVLLCMINGLLDLVYAASFSSLLVPIPHTVYAVAQNVHERGDKLLWYITIGLTLVWIYWICLYRYYLPPSAWPSCPRCYYNLRGAFSRVCPECGMSLEK